MNYDLLIPVRLNSSRLPKKAIRQISNKPIIIFLIDRLKKSTKINQIVICTTLEKSDDPLVDLLNSEGIKYFRGNEKDILVRLHDASKYFQSEFVVVVDGDDIYTDPAYVDKIIMEFQKTNADFICGKNFPHGFVPVGIKSTALKKICDLKMTNDTETGYREFFTQTNLFKCKYIEPEGDEKFPDQLRLTLDYEEDYEIAKKIFTDLGNYFQIQDILEYIEKNPDLLKKMKELDLRWKKHWNKNITNLSLRKQ